MKKYYLMPHPPIMIDKVGKGREKEIQDTINSCEQIGKEVSLMDVDTIIIISPHGLVFRDGIGIVTSDKLKGDLSKFGVEDVRLEFDINNKLTDEIINSASKYNILTAQLDEYSTSNYGYNLELDHGALVPLYYISKYKKYKLVHITYGMLSKIELYKFGVAIKESVEKLNEKAVLIASGDLSHRLKDEGPYSYSPSGEKFDKLLLDILENGNIEKLLDMDKKLVDEAGECGLKSLYILAGAMDSLHIKGELLSYQGNFGVGYGVVRFDTREGNCSLLKKLQDEEENLKVQKLNKGDMYTQLARKSLYYYFENKKYLTYPKDLPGEMINDRKGVFVSLKKEGELRGCIGTIGPTTENIASEIIVNSINAAIKDPRFSPVSEDELGSLDISVDVLFEPEPCTLNDLDVYEYGVIVSTTTKRGLLLPNLEGVNTVDEQIKIALQKAGIRYDEDFLIERFKVERHKENELDD